jgi:general secretion pathway protein K
MLITAVAAVAAAAMASRQNLDIRRTANLLAADQSYMFALGVEDWAVQILARDAASGQVDHLGEDWAVVLPPITVEGAVLGGHMEDMQGRYNLNNLVNNGTVSVEDLQRFQRLLQALDISDSLAQAVVDWIDEDEQAGFPDGAEDDVYLGLEVPYRTANSPMVSPSELLLVAGFTREVYDRLAPYVAALPERTPINVNTAAAPVLMSLVAGLTESEAEQLIEDRGEQGYQDVNAFASHQLLSGKNLNNSAISVASNYFMVSSLTQYGHSRMALNSLLRRAAGSKVGVVARAQGSY